MLVVVVWFMLINYIVFASQQTRIEVNPKNTYKKMFKPDMAQIYASIYRLEQFLIVERCKYLSNCPLAIIIWVNLCIS